MGDLKFRTEHETFLCEISGGVGGCPPPVSPPVTPPPVAEPHLIATPGGAVVGSMWVESSELHYVDSNGSEYAETGASVATPPGAVQGSYWMEADDMHYIDASGVERTISKQSMGAKAAPAITGSTWQDSAFTAARRVAWTSTTNKYQWWNGL